MHIGAGGDKAEDVAYVFAILVPEKALDEPGRVCTLTAAGSPGQKHAFHALAQTALIQFEDRELEPRVVDGKIRVAAEGETMELERGLVIGRLSTGEIVLLINSDQPPRKLLSAALRFCTRWIRLDL